MSILAKRVAGSAGSFTSVVTMAVAMAVGLLAVGLTMAVYNENQSRAAKLREVTVQADILAGSVSAALAFDDLKLAQEYVEALGVNPDVEVAGVYDLTGKLLAGYIRTGATPPASDSARQPPLEPNHIAVSRPVTQGMTALGSVYLRSGQEPFARRAARYGGIGLLVVMAALVVIVLGASNASLADAHRKLKTEMTEREGAEEALRISRELEAAAQIEIATQRSRAAVRQSEQQLEFALNAGRLGSWSIDLGSWAVTASEFFLANLGITSDHPPPADIKALQNYIHPDDHDLHRQAVERAGKDGGELEIECRTVSPQGQVRWILMRGRAVKDEDGVVRRMAGISLDTTARVQDQTERRAMEEQLRQVQKLEAIGQLTGGVAHDFNNLLGVIIGNLDMLLDTLKGDPDRLELTQGALSAALRGAELTKRLLAVARQQPLETLVIDLNERLPGMVTMLQRTLGESIHISTSLGENLWLARADPARVEDTLLNLSINARDAMPNGGSLVIETANVTLDEGFAAARSEVTPGDYVMLSVTDTGVGMPPEVIERATEPFYTTKPPGKGTGLGLSMIYGFAKQSGGHLSIYSEVGTGTTMRLYLPKAAAQAAAILSPPDAIELGHGGETILVVDDNRELRMVAVRRLRSLGYSCQEADNGPNALALLESGQSFDLLFTDIGLPDGLTGYELADLAVAHQPSLKVLFTTGYAKVNRHGWDNGTYRVLRKPYRSDELAESIRGVLDSTAQA